MTEPLRYYTRADVSAHTSRTDCWLIVHGRVVDFSSLIPGAPSELVDPILANAGGDVSHWFMKREDGLVDLKSWVNPVTNKLEPYMPEGRFLHVPVVAPSTAEADLPVETPWWRNPALLVGRLTQRPRTLNVVNTLTSQSHMVEFGDEETVGQMQHKYAAWNAHCGSYTWKAIYDGKTLALDVGKTLAENGIPDDREELERLGLDPLDPDNVVSILLYFNDDLSVA